MSGRKDNNSPVRNFIWCLRPVTFLLTITMLPACSGDRQPRREEIDGIEHVYNRVRPLEGTALPDPYPVDSLLLLEAGKGEIPSWSAIRDVRAAQAGGWAVIDMHRTEVTWFDPDGNITASMDLSSPPLGLTSPVAAAIPGRGGGISVDMALRRAVVFDAEGILLSIFDIEGGLPMDLDIDRAGDIFILTSSRPEGGREHLTQVRRYTSDGSLKQIAGSDSLLVEKRTMDEMIRPLPICLTVGPDGTLYAAGLNYTIHQVGADGQHRVIERQMIESRVPDYILEERRSLMQRRVTSQQREIPILEEVDISQLIALDNGGVLVQTSEWHPALLDEGVNSTSNILLLDYFSGDGSFTRRYAVELPLPRTLIYLTDEAEGTIFGYAIPFSSESPIIALRFRLPDVSSLPDNLD